MGKSSGETTKAETGGGGKGRSAPKGRPTPRAKDNQAAAQAAYQKAKMQWYAIGAVLVIGIVVAIVLLSIYTDGSSGAGLG